MEQAAAIGADISRNWIDLWSKGTLTRIDNNQKSILKYLRKLPEGTIVAMEATNDYHFLLADLAYGRGLRVYVINPRVTHHYMEALSMRGSTDPLAARGIASFIEHHHEDVRLYAPADPEIKKARELLRRRAKLVQERVTVQQSLRAIPGANKEIRAVIKAMDAAVAKIDELVDELLGGNDLRERLRTVPGIGHVASAVAATELQANEFATSDAFVAFCGLDSRPKESGKHKGQRVVSKRGSRTLRTAFYLAAFSASSSKLWRGYYQSLKARRLAGTQALIVLARKLARIAWSIQRHNTIFDPARVPTG